MFTSYFPDYVWYLIHVTTYSNILTRFHCTLLPLTTQEVLGPSRKHHLKILKHMYVWNGCREWCLPCLGRIFKNDHWNERIHEASMCVMMGTWVVSGTYNMHASTVVLCSKNKGTLRTLWQQPSAFHRHISDGCLCIYTNKCLPLYMWCLGDLWCRRYSGRYRIDKFYWRTATTKTTRWTMLK